MKRSEQLDKWRERRQEIVRLRNDELLTFDEIAKIIGVTRPRIIQIYQFETNKHKEIQ